MNEYSRRVLAPGEPSAQPDWAVVAVHIGFPLVVAAGFTLLLGESWSWPLLAVIFPLAALGLRPATWALGSGFHPTDKRRRRAYHARLKAAANTSLVFASILGLSFMDVFRLPGAPYWTNQPDAGLSLAAVAVYLVWVSSHANIPKEVKAGWRGLLGLKGSE